jgi:hypothetical protein
MTKIFKFFVVKVFFKKNDGQEKYFLQELGLSIVKNQLPL